MKKFISLVLAAVLIFSVIPVANAISYNGFKLEKKNGTYTVTGYSGSAADITIPETVNGINVTAVKKNAFQNKTRITTVRFPSSVKSIGASAFSGCKNLSSLILSSSVTSIGSKAFSNCTSLTGINLKSVKTVGEHAFYGCKNITNLTLGDTLKVIGNNAFQKCSSLNRITFTKTLTYIGDYSFADCSSITTLNLPDSLSHIGSSAFKGCKALTTLKFGSGALNIGAYAFENCTGLEKVIFPNSVKSIGRNAFAVRGSSAGSYTHNITMVCNKNSAAARYAKLYNASAYINEYNKTIKAFGDADNDGRLEKSDAKSLLRIAASMDKKLSGESLYRCDINSNNKIDTGDVSSVLNTIR